MQAINRSEIKVGTPLPWPVYDSQGALLLKKGYVIQSEAQLERLFARGLHAPVGHGVSDHAPHDRNTRPSSPFAERPILAAQLQALLALNTSPKDLMKRLTGLIQRIITLCDNDPEASLALVHLNPLTDPQQQESSPYDLILQHAILCHFIARQLQFDKPRHSLQIAAALVANLALVPFQAQLNTSSHRLTEKQRDVINRHPQLATEALQKAGFEQRGLLQVVIQHHERFDGKGYPSGLSDKEIRLEARILGLVEHYTALISPRAYRPHHTADDALQLILISMAEDPEQQAYEALSACLGPWPPGTLVRLINGEVALVTRPQSHTAQAVLSPSGEPYMGGMRRDTSEGDYRILSAASPGKVPSLNIPSLWGYG